MLVYGLIGLCLVLLGVAGLQFSYLFYVDRLYRERRKYLQTLENRYSRLTERLASAERRVAELEAAIGSTSTEEEMWADVIDDR